MAANVEDATTVDCTCQPTVSCVDQAGATIAAPEGTEALCDRNEDRDPRSATSNRVRTFLEGPAAIVTTLTITDKDGASDTVSLTTNTVNEPPQINALTVSLGAGAPGFSPIAQTNTPVSTIAGSPTEVSEGFNYTFNGTITEAGIDALTINWDLLAGVAGGNSTATAAVTKASYPNLTALTPATGLAPSIAYDDDNGVTPNSVDRTVNLTLTDDDGGGANADRFVRVVDVNPIITSFSSTTTSINEGGTVTFTVAAISGARDNSALDPINTSGFLWTIDGRNVSTLGSLTNAYTIVNGCTSSSTSCEVRFLDDDAPAGEPAWDVGVTVSDEDSTTTSSTITVNVANVLPVLTAFALADDDINEGDTASVSYSFTDPAGSLDGPYTSTVNFGGSAGPAVGARTNTDAAPGNRSGVAAAGAYRDNDDCQAGSTTSGTCTISADLCEVGDVRCATQLTDTLTVNNIAPTATASAVVPASLVEGVAFDLDGAFDDVAGSLDNNYAFTWNFNDGTTPRTNSGAAAFANSATGVDVGGVSGFTNVPSAGLSNVAFTLTVVDEDTGSTTSAPITASVRDNAPQITVAPSVSLGNAGSEPTGTATVSLTIRAETEADLIDHVDVNWGDGTVERYTSSISGISTTPTAITLTKGAGACQSGACVAGYADGRTLANGTDLPYAVTVTVADEDSTTVATPASANVINVDPVLANANVVPDVNIPIVIAEGTAAAFVITTTDVSSADRAGSRLTSVANLNARGLLAEVDFGDGSPVELIPGDQAGLNTIIRTAHVYSDVGRFDVTIRTFDQDAQIDTDGTLVAGLVNSDLTDGVSNTVSAVVEVVNLAPILTDVFTSQPVSEGVDMNAVALVNNRGLDPLAFSYIFDCAPANATEAAIIAAFVASRAGAGPDINAATSAVGHHTYADEGNFTVCVEVCDDDDAENSCDYGTANVEVFNQPAVLALSAADTTINEGGNTNLTASANDLGSDLLVYAFDCQDDGVVDTLIAEDDEIDIGDNAVANCVYPESGTFTARVTVDDGLVLAERTVTITVANVAPNVAAAAANAASVAEGVASSLTFTGATDVAADPIRVEYDIDGDNAPDLVSTAANGAASFRFANASGASTSNAFRARACDDENACSAFVAGTAVVTNVAPVIAVVNVPGQVAIASPLAVSVVATDVGNDALTYAFAFTGPETLNITAQASSVASASFATTGTYTVTVSVSDGTNTTTSTATFAVVEGANEAPRITSFTTSNAVVNEGGSVTLTAAAIDNGSDPLTFAFDCGNGTTVAASTSTTASCTYAQSGNFIASVVVADDASPAQSATQVLAIRSVNVAPAITAANATVVNEGVASTLTVSGVSDVAGDIVRIEYDTNGDGAFDLVSNAANGSATVRFADGSNGFAARACDNEGACSDTVTAAALVNNVAPVITSLNVPATALAGSPVTVAATATDAGNDALLYTFTFSRGGNEVQQVGPQASSTISATFSDSGTYEVEVAVTDAANSPATIARTTATASFLVNDLNVNVVASASPASINEGDSTTITVTSTNGVGPFVVDYDVNADGDFVDAVDVRGQECEGNVDVPCRITASFPQNRAGNIAFRVIVSVTDTGNNDALETAIVAVEVKNVAPTLDAVDDDSVEENATFTTTLAATDPGVAAANADFPAPDALTFSLVSGPEGLTVSSAGVVSWTPTFSDEGTHTVTVRATDSDGESDETEFDVTVTIIDSNDNGLSDTQELALNGGVLLDPEAGETDADVDGVSDLDEVLAGTLPNESDAPRAPVVISPNNVTIDTATPTLTVANAFSPRELDLTYVFVVVDSAGAEVARIEDVVEGATTTTATVPAGALDEQATYTWFAFAKDGLTTLDETADIEGDVSDTGTFVVDSQNAAPTSPDALTPANDAEFLEGTFVTLEARAVVDADGDAVSYVFQVATDAAFTTIVKTSPARDVPVFSMPEALAVGSYFWRATASDGTATSAPGTVGNFDVVAIEINDAPTAPTITSPNNETIAATSATLTIGAGADADNDVLEYEFEIADNAAFANAEVSGAQAGLTFAVEGLDEDATFFWRARAFDGQLYSDWVSATFVVDAENGVPTGLALLSPTDGALLTSAPVAFTATEAVDPEGDALTYQVVVSKSADFSAPIVDTAAVVEGGVVRLAAPETLAEVLELGVPYFWRVTASDGSNSIEASASFSLFKPQEIPDDVSVQGGGCNASGNDSNGTAVALALLGLVVLRRRRR